MDLSILSRTSIRLLFTLGLNGSCVCVNDCVYIGGGIEKLCCWGMLHWGVTILLGVCCCCVTSCVSWFIVIVGHLFSYFKLKLVVPGL